MISSKSSSLPRTMENVNIEPLPNFDLTPITPLKDLTMFSDITSPRPIPCVFIYRVLFSVPNNLKSFILSFGLIPIPESITEITNLSLVARGLNIFSMLCSSSNFLAADSLDSESDPEALSFEERDSYTIRRVLDLLLTLELFDLFLSAGTSSTKI